jgi:hypothetical protein
MPFNLSGPLGEPGELLAFPPHHVIREAGPKYLLQLQILCHAEPQPSASVHWIYEMEKCRELPKRRIPDVKSKGGIDTLCLAGRPHSKHPPEVTRGASTTASCL